MRDSIYCARLLAFVTGLVNQELLLQNEYLAAENRILRAHLPTRLRLSDPERSTLAEIGKRLGRKALKEVARTARRLTWRRSCQSFKSILISTGRTRGWKACQILADPRHR